MDNSLKNPFYQKFPLAVQEKIDNALLALGSVLPCHVISANGPMITVAFDVSSVYPLPQVTIPIFGPEYVRYPIQVGDKGVAFQISTNISKVTAQGNGTPDLSMPANLSALVFMPIGSKQWVSVNGNAVVIYGPDGVEIRDTGSNAIITLTPTGITAQVGSTNWQMVGNSITFNTTTFVVNAPTITLNGQLTQGTEGGGYPATLQGPITVVNNVTANGVSLDTHVHSGVQTGSGDTGPPT